MSAIINAILQHKAGQASSQREINHVGPTTGHHETAGGLRGHSIDQETYPWRTLGHPGGAWSVVDANSREQARFTYQRHVGGGVNLTPEYLDDIACEEAHSLARRLKIDFPTGRV